MTSSKYNYLPNVPPPNTIILGVRASTYELGIGREGLAKLSVHNNTFNLIKDIYQKPTIKIIFTHKTIGTVSLKI